MKSSERPLEAPKGVGGAGTQVDAWCAGAADGLLFFLLAYAAIRVVSIPAGDVPSGIVSATSRIGFEPLTNYVRLAIPVAAGGLAFLRGVSSGRGFVEWSLGLITAFARRGALPKFIVLGTTLVIALMLALSVGVASIQGPLTDGFHEGEYLGFVPILREQLPAFASTFLIHGPGINLLPSWVASLPQFDQTTIPAARVVIAGLRVFAVLLAVAVVFLTVRLARPYWSLWRTLAASAVGFSCIAVVLELRSPGILAHKLSLSAKDSIFLLQLVLTLGAFVANRSLGKLATLASACLFALFGMSVPLGFFYSYDRGALATIFAGLLALILVLSRVTRFRVHVFAVLGGAIVGGVVAFVVFGPSAIANVAEQVLYWVRYSRFIWSYASVLAPDTFGVFLLCIATLCSAAVVATWVAEYRRRRSVSEATARTLPYLVLLAAAAPSFRFAAERGDYGHIMVAVIPSFLLLAVWLALAAGTAFGYALLRRQRARGPMSFGISVGLIVISVATGLGPALINPLSLFNSLQTWKREIGISDQSRFPNEWRAASEAVHDLIGRERCFYTLTSEAAWYLLFNKASCSRFHTLAYARTEKAQGEVVKSLQMARPGILLVESGGLSNRIDNVSTYNTHRLVIEHVLAQFEPYRLIGNSWFWREREANFRIFERAESASTVVKRATTRVDSVLEGVIDASVPQGDVERSAILLTVGDADRPIWAGRWEASVNARKGYRAVVPTAALGRGQHRVKVWALHAAVASMWQLSDVLVLEVE